MLKLLLLKPKINIILPIALALILPGIGFYMNETNPLNKGYWYLFSWGYSSLMLYTLWQLLWRIGGANAGKERWWWIGGLVLFILVGILLPSFYIQTTLNYLEPTLILRIFLMMLMFSAIQYALRAQENISRLMIEKEQMQTENYKAQLKAIRAQIDPHFLFNTLNTLRSMIRQQHPNAEEFIVSLSDFYRNTLKHNDNITLPLSEELAVLESYLFVMKSRNEAAIAIDIQVDESLYSHHLPSLALQVVVENCFKHNSMTSKKPLQIDIRNSDNQHIQVTNNIQPKISDEDASGFGLNLLKKRYALMDVKEGMNIQETPDLFSVKLKLLKP